MTKRRIVMNESQLHNFIKESVKRVLSEISTDTLDSAVDSAKEKYSKTYNKYGSADPRTTHAGNQYNLFNNEYKKRYEKGNDAKKARMLKNHDDRVNGKRDYDLGTHRWRNV